MNIKSVLLNTFVGLSLFLGNTAMASLDESEFSEPLETGRTWPDFNKRQDHKEELLQFLEEYLAQWRPKDFEVNFVELPQKYLLFIDCPYEDNLKNLVESKPNIANVAIRDFPEKEMSSQPRKKYEIKVPSQYVKGFYSLKFQLFLKVPVVPMVPFVPLLLRHTTSFPPPRSPEDYLMQTEDQTRIMIVGGSRYYVEEHKYPVNAYLVDIVEKVVPDLVADITKPGVIPEALIKKFDVVLFESLPVQIYNFEDTFNNILATLKDGGQFIASNPMNIIKTTLLDNFRTDLATGEIIEFESDYLYSPPGIHGQAPFLLYTDQALAEAEKIDLSFRFFEQVVKPWFEEHDLRDVIFDMSWPKYWYTPLCYEFDGCLKGQKSTYYP